MRPIAKLIPNKKWRKKWVYLLHKTAVIPEKE